MDRKTFAELYCEQHAVPRQSYNAVVFRLALYPHARPFVAALGTLRSELPQGKYELLDDLGGDRALVRRKLRFNLRPVANTICSFNLQHFQADFQFVEQAGRLTRYWDFPSVVEDFIWHHSNSDFSRRMLRLRVSVRRMNRLVRSVFATVQDLPPAGDEELNSRSPFKCEDPGGRPDRAGKQAFS